MLMRAIFVIFLHCTVLCLRTSRNPQAAIPGAKPHAEKSFGDNLGKRLNLFVLSTGFKLIKYDSDHVMKKTTFFNVIPPA
ncbi:hypothetical protein DMH27_08660 [Raoultella planticola]|nr:hypothetical protein [Raoultella planticola]